MEKRIQDFLIKHFGNQGATTVREKFPSEKRLCLHLVSFMMSKQFKYPDHVSHFISGAYLILRHFIKSTFMALGS